MRVRVRLFARLRELAGSGEIVRDVPPGSTAEAVWNDLASECPALAPYRSVASCAVNEEYARFDALLDEGDEVAFLPPVSGGSADAVGAPSGMRMSDLDSGMRHSGPGISIKDSLCSTS